VATAWQSACAQDNRRIDNVGRPVTGKQNANSRRIKTVHRSYVSRGLSDQSSESSLSGTVADRLGQRRRRHGNPHTAFSGSCDESKHAAIVAVECNERASV
jgi:hypothetical protein